MGRNGLFMLGADQLYIQHLQQAGCNTFSDENATWKGALPYDC